MNKCLILLGIIAILTIGWISNFYYQYERELNLIRKRVERYSLEIDHHYEQKMNQLFITTKYNNLLISFNSKIIISTKKSFISLYNSEAKIESNGQSFYDIQQSPIISCRMQTITSIERQDQGIILNGYFEDCKDSNYTIKISSVTQDQLSLSVQPKSNKFNRVVIQLYDTQQSIYYGLGEQFSYLSLGRGKPYSLFVRQKGIARSQFPQTFLEKLFLGSASSYYNSYCPIPIWYSNLKLAFIADQSSSYAYSAWMNNKFLIWGNRLSLKIISKKTYKQLIRQVGKYNGVTKKTPSWVNQGAILGLQGGTLQVLKKYHIMKKSGTVTSGLWLQDWVGKRMSLGYSRLWWVWQLDKIFYKDWLSMQEELQKDQVNLLTYINPMFTNSSSKQNAHNYFQEGRKHGYFQKDSQKNYFQSKFVSDFTAHLLNFSHPETYNFLKKVIKNTLQSTKIKGMMVDFGEASHLDPSSIDESMLLHNQYPKIYHEAVHNILNQLLGENHDFYTFGRAGSFNSSFFMGSLWTGDQNMNYRFHNGIPSCLAAILSSGLSGFLNSHCDIGAYVYIKLAFIPLAERTEVFMIRSMQLAAFTSVFRSHEGNKPDQSLQIYSNEKMANNFAFYSNIYNILASYRKQIQSSKENRLPIARPMFLQLQDNEQVAEIQDQYYLGSHILVAPYLFQQKGRNFYLPQGNWTEIWTGQEIKGCNCYKSWSKSLPAVFINDNYQQKKTIIDQVKQVVQKYKKFIEEEQISQL